MPTTRCLPCLQVWTLVGEEARVAAAKETATAPVIDITKHGECTSSGAGALQQAWLFDYPGCTRVCAKFG